MNEDEVAAFYGNRVDTTHGTDPFPYGIDPAESCLAVRMWTLDPGDLWWRPRDNTYWVTMPEWVGPFADPDAAIAASWLLVPVRRA